MAKFRFHKLVALLVLAGFAGWVATGEFSSVGSAQNEGEAKAPEAAEQAAVVRTVAVVTPPRIQHSRAIRVSGRTEADKRTVITSRVEGIIAELPVAQGDLVSAGDLILRLDEEDKAAAVENARALLEQREAEWTAAERLSKSGSLPKLQLDNAWSELVGARAALQAAEAQLARNEIKAPFGGVVDRLDVELGSTMMQGEEVATLIALDPIIARGEVSERDLRHLTIGDSAEVRLVNGNVVKGTVRYVSREATEQTRTFPVEISIANPERTIPAGMTAEITLFTDATDAVVLPRSVVTLSGKGDLGIRAVDGESKVVFFPIDLVDDIPSGIVVAGIPADARIIVAGQDLVTEGDVVKAVEADKAAIDRLLGEAAAGTQ
jgi:multidrug efflux system membrane fusion protein